MNCLFLYNPMSGRCKIQKKIAYIRRRLQTKFDEVIIEPTKSGEDLEARVREGAGLYDVILFSGGDGTFNHVLQGVGERKVKLGYIPAGTVNDVAHSLRIPRSVKGAVNTVLKGHTEEIDCMRVNGTQYAMYVAAAGTFTKTTYETPQSQKKKFGRVAYTVHGIKENLHFEVFPFRGDCDGQQFETHGVIVLVMNGRRVAGFRVNRGASMQDGVLEVAIVKQYEKPTRMQKFRKYFTLLSLLFLGARKRRKDVVYLRGKEVTFETGDNLVWDFDGEKGISGNAHIEVLPRHVTLFVPATKKTV